MSTSKKSENSTCSCSDSSEHRLCSPSCATDDCYYGNSLGPIGVFTIPGSGALNTNINPVVMPSCPRDQQDNEGEIICVSDCCDFLDTYNNINFINGDLVISASTLTKLANIFPELLVISGNLYIIGTQYTSITGFNKLRTVGGSIVFANNQNLTTMPTFPSLLTVSGKVNPNAHYSNAPCGQGAIAIVNNGLLRKIIGFESLRQVKWGIIIANNACLTHICGFLHLYRTDYIIISKNCRLSKITGFCYTVLVNESLLILDNNANSNNDLVINAFLTLESVDSLVVTGNKFLRKLEFNALKNICCCFVVRSNPQLECLSSSVKRANSLKIEKNNSLVVICFPELDEINCALYINKNAQLEKLDTFDDLKRVGHVIMISENKQLNQLHGFNKLKFVGSCCVQDKHHCDPLPNPCFIEDCVNCIAFADPDWDNVFSRRECVVVDGLGEVIDMYDDGACSACEYELPSLFYQLACVKDAKCGEFSERTSFKNADFSIIIYGNPRLRCIDGFGCLRHLESILYIVGNATLSVIDAFSHLASVLDVWVRNNPSLKYIKGFHNLLSIRNLIVKESNCLAEWDDLHKLQFAQFIDIQSNKVSSVQLAVAPIPSVKGQIEYFAY